MSAADCIYRKVRDQFGKTASGYLSSPGHAKGEDLKAMVHLAGDLQGRAVLDVATGGGHTALAFARAGAVVTATDLTSEMLEAAHAFAEEEGVRGVTFLLAAAEELPFEDDSFEIVSCRIAPHHFADPRAFVWEAARVLVPGGLILIVDNVAPEDPELNRAMNRIERERDPSHVETYTVRRWINWLADAGFDLAHIERFRRDEDFRSWLERAHTPAETGEVIERYVLGLPPRIRHYLNVVEEGGQLVSLAHEAASMMAVLMIVQND